MEDNQEVTSPEYYGTIPLILVGIALVAVQLGQVWLTYQDKKDSKTATSDVLNHNPWEAQLRSQQMIVDVQKKIADACINKGPIPVFMGGNVDCKPLPK